MTHEVYRRLTDILERESPSAPVPRRHRRHLLPHEYDYRHYRHMIETNWKNVAFIDDFEERLGHPGEDPGLP